MPTPTTPLPPANDDLVLGFTFRRVIVTMIVATAIGGLNALPSSAPLALVVARVWIVASWALSMFVLIERWPRRLPSWCPRWALQLVGVVLVSFPGTVFTYWLTTGQSWAWTHNKDQLNGFGMLLFSGILFAPWTTLGAVVHQRGAQARAQALRFALERSQLEHQALDARMRLLQAQIQPHFLFNTLANVQALVDAGSPQAGTVLRALVAYLRAAVPRLDEAETSLGQEAELVRAYLELMHLRMPDRLRYQLDIDADALALRCPPLSLLTLVENAVRHGIDPSEDGGEIVLTVRVAGGRCQVRVADSGVGLRTGTGSLGTGLATLRERLALAFGGDASLRLMSRMPRGVSVELDFPALRRQA